MMIHCLSTIHSGKILKHVNHTFTIITLNSCDSGSHFSYCYFIDGSGLGETLSY